MHRILPAMMILFTSLLGVGLIATTGPTQDKKPQKKTSVVEGAWSMMKGDAKVTLTFAGDQFTMTKSKGDKAEKVTGTFKVDATKTPNSIDITVTGGDAKEAEKYKGKTSLGIVQVDGDKLQWCANEPGKDRRPKAFADKEGDDGNLYVTAQREKK